MKALVVLSGGQDSSTILLHTKLVDKMDVEAISFYYGQRHGVEEMKCAGGLCKKHNIPHKQVSLKKALEGLTDSALLNVTDDISKIDSKTNLPVSFVPNRNQLMLTLAYTWAMTRECNVVLIGACQTDYSGYPDCREEFIRSFNVTTQLGTGTAIGVVAPLMNMSKKQIWQIAHQGGFLDEIIENTHTCYNGDHVTKHDWGYGCGNCPACVLREKGFKELFIDQKETANHVNTSL